MDTAAPEMCVELSVAPEDCTAGERVDVTVRDCADGVWDDGISILVSADLVEVPIGTFDDTGVFRTSYTCPEVDCPGVDIGLYVKVKDARSAVDWAFAGQYVTCAPEEPRQAEGERGCGGGAAVGLFAGLFGWSRKRR